MGVRKVFNLIFNVTKYIIDTITGLYWVSVWTINWYLIGQYESQVSDLV